MRRKGDMERHVKKKQDIKIYTRKKKTSYPDKHNFSPDEAKEDYTNADRQNMYAHNTDRLYSYVVILQLQAKSKGVLVQNQS